MKDDKGLQRDVLDQLQWEPSVDAAEIGVAVHEGVVTLTGEVKSYAEKLAAGRLALGVRGVKAIANDIEVRPGRHHARTDADIARVAAEALEWRTTVPRDRIKVSVSRGWVSLEGEVDWQYQKEAAEDAVRPLLGVLGVLNEIDVKPRASATDVKVRIEKAIERSAELDAKGIRVESRDGEVTLRGDVRSWTERQEAERTAWSAPGVKKVENLISVTPWTH